MPSLSKRTITGLGTTARCDAGVCARSDEPPILGATDCVFFIGPDGKRFISPVSLVSSLSFPFYLAAMRRPDLAADPRFGTPQDRRRNLEALQEIVQRWIWSFTDMASLEAQLDEAKIPIGSLRDISEFAQTEWATLWGATRTVPNGAGGRITVPRAPLALHQCRQAR